MRWIVRSVFAVLLLVVLAVGALFLIPAEKIAGGAVAKFNALTGRELVLSGSVRPSVWPVLGVKTGPVSISNAEWSDQGPMLQAEGLAIVYGDQMRGRGKVRHNNGAGCARRYAEDADDILRRWLLFLLHSPFR